MKKAAMFIAFKGFRDEEYLEPKKALEAAGIEVVTVSTAKGAARGKLGAVVQVDKTIDEIRPADYDALTLVGGPGALEHLDNEKVHKIFQQAAAQGKIIGAICISPVVLAHAGLLSGKTVACFPDGAEEVKKAGAKYTGKDLEVDGKLVTAGGPGPAAKYGTALAQMLK
ncbi:MAG: DJ-1/PfpI family protein [Elusimicrobiota bacterium]|jgi:protease I